MNVFLLSILLTTLLKIKIFPSRNSNYSEGIYIKNNGECRCIRFKKLLLKS